MQRSYYRKHYLCYANIPTGMTEEQSRSRIEELLAENVHEALQLLEVHTQKFGQSEQIFLLEGKARLKLSDWRRAQNAFLQAHQLNGQGVAKQYLEMLTDIMDFYNKDMFNQ